jgi:hypothetical protein
MLRAVPEISEDKLSVSMITQMVAPPPLLELSLGLGDALHNWKSALDAAVWSLSTYEGRNPRNPTQVYFPVCQTENEWTKKTTGNGPLSGLPGWALERLRLVQPFNQPSETTHALTLLHQLDIQDKHRALLNTALRCTEISWADAQIDFEDDPDIPTPSFEVVRSETADLVIGQPILTLRSSARFKSVRIPLTISADFGILYEGAGYELSMLLDTFAQGVRTTLDLLYYGAEGVKRHYERMASAPAFGG